MPRTPTRGATARRPVRSGVLAGLVLPAAVAALPAAPAHAQTGDGAVMANSDIACLLGDIDSEKRQAGSVYDSASYFGNVATAAADAHAQRAMALARAQYQPDSTWFSASCSADAGFDNLYTVVPGSTGLPKGAQVTLVATPLVDAVLSQNVDDDEAGTTSWTFDAGYRVAVENDCPEPGEGDEYDEGSDDYCPDEIELARFHTNEERRIQTVLHGTYDEGGSLRVWRDFDWSVRSNTGQDERMYDSTDTVECQEFPCDVPDGEGQALGPVHPRKTSAILTFTAKVGDVLRVSGGVQLYTGTTDTGEGFAYADATEGLTGTLMAAPQSAGVQLVPGVVPVDDVEVPDTTAPTVSATTSAPANDAGWHREDVTVELAATDDVAPTSVSYRIGAGDPVVIDGANASVPVTGEGETTLTYWATDAAGNSSTPQELVVRLDKTAPTLHLPADITLDATDETGRVWEYPAMATDGTTELPATCTPASGSLFPVGTTTIACEAVDVAGNTGRGEIDVTVLPFAVATPTERIAALKSTLSTIAAPGAAKPLSAKLDVALKHLAKGKTANACTQLAQFEQMTAQRIGKQLDAATADSLIAESASIREVLC